MKKIAGFLMLVVAVVLCMAALTTFPKGILDSIIEIKKDTASGLGFLFGTLIGIALFTILIVFLFRRGFKFVRRTDKKILPQNPE